MFLDHQLFDLRPRPTLRRWLARAFLVEGTAAGVRHYRELTRQHPDRFDESSLNFIGYLLLTQERIAEALALFELIVEAFPESANAHDSLGEACLRAGLHDRAFQCYWRSVELDAENRNGWEMLRQLEN